MTEATTHRIVVVHGTPGTELVKILKQSGLEPVVDDGDVTVWAPNAKSPELRVNSLPPQMRTRPSGSDTLDGPQAETPHERTPQLLLTTEEAALALGIGRTGIYELLKSGQLTSVLIGRSRRIRTSDLQELVSNIADSQSTQKPAH